MAADGAAFKSAGRAIANSPPPAAAAAAAVTPRQRRRAGGARGAEAAHAALHAGASPL